MRTARTRPIPRRPTSGTASATAIAGDDREQDDLADQPARAVRRQPPASPRRRVRDGRHRCSSIDEADVGARSRRHPLGSVARTGPRRRPGAGAGDYWRCPRGWPWRPPSARSSDRHRRRSPPRRRRTVPRPGPSPGWPGGWSRPCAASSELGDVRIGRLDLVDGGGRAPAVAARRCTGRPGSRASARARSTNSWASVLFLPLLAT